MSDTRRSFNRTTWFGSLCLCLFTTLSALANPIPAGVREVRHLEGITEYKLDSNGLTILLAPDASSASVTVNMTYLVGSRHENYGQTGMAHLLEHMIFRGTPTTRNALAEFSKRGLQANGSTSDDRTNYYATFSANSETLDWYIRWQADAMVNSLIAREDLDSEMTVVRNEMERNENNPVRMLIEKTRSVAFDWHNYGKSTIGARSDVEGVDIAQLQDFYRRYYQPDNAVLTVAGKFDVEQTLQVIAEAFQGIARPERALPDQYTLEPVQDGERRVTLRRNGGTPVALAIYHIPPATHPDYAAIDLAALMLSDTPSGRLYKALVQTGLATSVGGGAWENKDPGTALFLAQLGPEQNPEKALAALTATIENIRTEPFTEEELTRAKSQWLNGWNKMFSDMSRVGTALSEPIGLGDWRLLFKMRDRIQETSLAQVQQVAQQFFLHSNRTEGLYIPTEKPERAPALKPVDLQAALEGYESKATNDQTETFDASPANIDALTQRKVLNLPTGAVKLALLPKSTRGDRVTAIISMRFGDAELLKGKRTLSSVAAGMLAYGTQKMSRQEIEDQFEKLQTQYSISGSGTTVQVHLSSSKQTLPDAIKLTLQLLKEPSYPADQLSEYINQSITGIKASMMEPESVAGLAVARYGNPYPKDDLRYQPTFEESIEQLQAIKREDLLKFHQQFYGNGNILVSAVGAFEPEPIETILTQGLSDWKKAPAFQRVLDPYTPLKPIEMILETPDKSNAFFLAKLPIKMQDTDPQYPSALMANYLLGQSHYSRLWMRIRETDGLSYTVSSSLDASAFEPSAEWVAYAIYAPENLQRLQQAFQEELTRALKDGFTQAELDTGIKALLNLRALSRSRDGALASTWMSFLNTNRTFAWSQAFEDKLKSLTLDEVNQTLRKYIKPEDLVRAYAGDFVNKPPAQATKQTTPK